MGTIPALEQNYLYGQYGKNSGIGRLGGLTINPTRVAPVESGNEYGISIPRNHSYTTDETGSRVALGQDGVGLAHKNPEEYNFHLIA